MLRLIEQLIDLEKARTENFKFRTDLEIKLWMVGHWSVTQLPQQMNVYKGRQIKISSNQIEACPVNTGHYMALKHHISFATDLAANFGCHCDQFRITPDIVSKLLRAAV